MTKVVGICLCVIGLLTFVYGTSVETTITTGEPTETTTTEASDHHKEDVEAIEPEDRHQDSKDTPVVVTEFETKNWQVAAALFKGARTTHPGNLVFSPLSLTTSMVMLIRGAEDKTASEIQNFFKFGSDPVLNQTNVLKSLKTQTPAEGEDSGVKLETASRIFANKENANLLETYTTAVRELGEVEPLDFTQPEKVVAHMNEWVKNQTHGKILKIAGDKDFDKETAAVLLDALYFKAPWKHQFKKNNTKKDQEFHVSKDETVKVEMMYISEKFPYDDLTEDGVTAVFLPYKGDRFSMIIYLPHEGKNLTTLEKKLETFVPSEIRKNATTTEISLYLPKFNISSTLDLKSVFTSLGVQSMFNRTTADFSKMSTSQGFHVSKLMQQVFIQVDEEGAEAAAVTETHNLGPTSVSNTVKVNRPFIFQILDSVTHTILFTGRIKYPNGNPVPTPTPPPITNGTSPAGNATQQPSKGSKGTGTRNSNGFLAPILIVCSLGWLKVWWW